MNCDVIWGLSRSNVPSTNMEEAGFMTFTSASHQGAIKMMWLHYWAAVMLSIFLFTLWLWQINCDTRPPSKSQMIEILNQPQVFLMLQLIKVMMWKRICLLPLPVYCFHNMCLMRTMNNGRKSKSKGCVIDAWLGDHTPADRDELDQHR